MASYAIRRIYTWTVETFRPEHEALFEFHLVHVMKRAAAWIETRTDSPSLPGLQVLLRRPPHPRGGLRALHQAVGGGARYRYDAALPG